MVSSVENVQVGREERRANGTDVLDSPIPILLDTSLLFFSTLCVLRFQALTIFPFVQFSLLLPHTPFALQEMAMAHPSPLLLSIQHCRHDLLDLL